MGSFNRDKQKSSGEEDGRDAYDSARVERKQINKRHRQERQYFRVVYPPAVNPVVVNFPALVLDISTKAVKFVLSGNDVNNLNLGSGSKIDIVIRFHDNQTIKTTGTILRRETDQSEGKIYVCIFDREIPSEVISKEQAHLLKNFPDFCRDKFLFRGSS
jgi:hypothetical protein